MPDLSVDNMIHATRVIEMRYPAVESNSRNESKRRKVSIPTASGHEGKVHM